MSLKQRENLELKPIIKGKILSVKDGKIYLLNIRFVPVLRIGRGEENDISIKSQSVSYYHAEIHFTKNQFYLNDINSMNGTFVNKKRVSNSTVLMRHGDVIRFGLNKLTFVFYSGDRPFNRDRKKDEVVTNKKTTAPPQLKRKLLEERRKLKKKILTGREKMNEMGSEEKDISSITFPYAKGMITLPLDYDWDSDENEKNGKEMKIEEVGEEEEGDELNDGEENEEEEEEEEEEGEVNFWPKDKEDRHGVRKGRKGKTLPFEKMGEDDDEEGEDDEEEESEFEDDEDDDNLMEGYDDKANRKNEDRLYPNEIRDIKGLNDQMSKEELFPVIQEVKKRINDENSENKGLGNENGLVKESKNDGRRVKHIEDDGRRVKHIEDDGRRVKNIEDMKEVKKEKDVSPKRKESSGVKDKNTKGGKTWKSDEIPKRYRSNETDGRLRAPSKMKNRVSFDEEDEIIPSEEKKSENSLRKSNYEQKYKALMNKIEENKVNSQRNKEKLENLEKSLFNPISSTSYGKRQSERVEIDKIEDDENIFEEKDHERSFRRSRNDGGFRKSFLAPKSEDKRNNEDEGRYNEKDLLSLFKLVNEIKRTNSRKNYESKYKDEEENLVLNTLKLINKSIDVNNIKKSEVLEEVNDSRATKSKIVETRLLKNDFELKIDGLRRYCGKLELCIERLNRKLHQMERNSNKTLNDRSLLEHLLEIIEKQKKEIMDLHKRRFIFDEKMNEKEKKRFFDEYLFIKRENSEWREKNRKKSERFREYSRENNELKKQVIRLKNIIKRQINDLNILLKKKEMKIKLFNRRNFEFKGESKKEALAFILKELQDEIKKNDEKEVEIMKIKNKFQEEAFEKNELKLEINHLKDLLFVNKSGRKEEEKTGRDEKIRKLEKIIEGLNSRLNNEIKYSKKLERKVNRINLDDKLNPEKNCIEYLENRIQMMEKGLKKSRTREREIGEREKTIDELIETGKLGTLINRSKRKVNDDDEDVFTIHDKSFEGESGFQDPMNLSKSFDVEENERKKKSRVISDLEGIFQDSIIN